MATVPPIEKGPATGSVRLGIATVGLGVAIAVVSLAADPFMAALDRAAPGADKLLHALGFLVLFTAGDRLRSVGAGPPLLARATLAVALAGFATLDEVSQAFRPERTAEYADLTASLAGIALGLAFAWRSSRVRLARVIGATAVIVTVGLAAWSFDRLRYWNAGLQFSREGDFVAARTAFRQAYDRGQRGSALLNELAWVEVESGQGNPAEAVAFARQAVAARPDDPDYLDTLGWALYAAGHHAEALQALEKAYAAKPDMYCIHRHLGEVYLSLGQVDLARDHLRQQVALPDRREARLAAATLSTLQGGAPR